MSLIKNEEDIIPYMIDHHQPHIDTMIILDNQSTDNTPNILREKAKKYDNLIIVDDITPEFDFINKMDSLIKSAAHHHQADWIIPIDADEFIQPIHTLPNTLETLDPNNAYRIMWQNHIPTVDDDNTIQNPIERITHHPPSHYEIFNKMILSREIALKTTITMGGHGLKPTPRLIKLYNHVLAHYPIRTPEQIYQKVMKLKQATAYDPTPGNHHHVKKMHKTFTEQGQPTQSELTELLYQYTKKP